MSSNATTDDKAATLAGTNIERTDSTTALAMEHHRLAMHLNLLEKDATHPIDLVVEGSHMNPALVLRAGQALRSAHSDVRLDYELMREVLMEVIRTRIAELDEKLVGTQGGNQPIERLQYGDQTEA
ncbi:hypothetical protein AncyloWKF20_13095 [Ancylobacter sp. WKF20]|uniref:hypothetical protein n=1 Tax=Ancylobacter sp. WKF20 TaxID=3039801 RepID=UPI0024342409|nr:hypothetical protein [Ancylobacter sp. WKF20]WGD28734.1 hypothetical protein AncyloWKF20_13095 [Ancylobacter sp. WKF20]